MKKSNAIVLMNENHSLMSEQEKILNEKFNWEFYYVPKDGWTKAEMDENIKKIINKKDTLGSLTIVFVSPIPYMLMELTRQEFCENTNLYVRVFHNDNRTKKELPNGKIISVVSQEGWQLL